MTKQKRYKRVRSTINDKEQLVLKKLKENSIKLSELNILIIAYKYESEVEIFAKKKDRIYIQETCNLTREKVM